MLELVDIPREASDDVAIIGNGEYDIPLASAPATVLDIGGNIGAFSLWAAKKWPGARVMAYEPWPENADSFEKNCKGVESITLARAGVRGFTGAGVMHRGRNRMCCSFVESMGDAVESPFIDAGDLNSAEFVKIDCEGTELEILRRLDLSNTKALCVEVHDVPRDMQPIKDIAAGAGLKCILDRHSVNGCHLAKFARETALAPKVRKLMICVPVYGDVNIFFVQSLMKLLHEPPCHISVKFVPGDSLVARARNTLTAYFMASDCDEMLFLDSDLIFSTDHIKALMQHDPIKYPVVAGLYPKKQEGPVQWVCNSCFEATTVLENGLQKVRYMGTGCLKVHRSVFERMMAELPISFVPDHDPNAIQWDFWPVGVYRGKAYPKGRYLSEDWYFCQNWLDMGGEVYADSRIVLKHCGQAIYPLQTQCAELMKLTSDAK